MVSASLEAEWERNSARPARPANSQKQLRKSFVQPFGAMWGVGDGSDARRPPLAPAGRFQLFPIDLHTFFRLLALQM